MTRLLIADPHPVFALGLRHLCEGEGYEVVGTADSVGDVIRHISSAAIDVIIADKRLPDGGAIALLKYINDNRLGIRTMFVADALYDRELAEAQALNASCIVGKDRTPEQYVECIHAVLKGRNCCAPPNREPSKAIAPLTKREQEIVDHVLQGKQNKDIAALAGIKTGTVKIHLARIYKKLGIKNRVQLSLYMNQLQ